MLERAQSKPKIFTLAEYLIPTEKQMYNQILKMAEFSKQILLEIASAAALQLLNKRVLNIKFKGGDLVYLPDRILRKHPHSLRDALGKIKKIQETGRNYIIQMIDGGELKRHFSDIVCASATTNQSDITLIDPFQLVDYKTGIPPEHMYPQFKLIVDKFKSQEDNQQEDVSDLPILEDQEHHTYSQQEYEKEHDEIITGDQRIQNAVASESPHTTDNIIRTMMENTTPEIIEIPQDLRHIKNPNPSTRGKIKKTKKNPPLDIMHQFKFDLQYHLQK